jgi:hypothetical protein
MGLFFMNMLGFIACYWKFLILHYIQLYTTSHVVWDGPLKAESHLYIRLTAVYWAHSAICIKCYESGQPMNSTLSSSDTASLSSLLIVALQWLLLTCHCQTNWEPVLTDLVSEFPAVADAAEQGAACFSPVEVFDLISVIIFRHGPHRKQGSLFYSDRLRRNVFVCEGVTQ